MNEERAVIDIGSNTVRLVIYGGPARAPTVAFNERVTARLGRGVSEDGLIGRRAMELALASLARFAAILRLRGIDAPVVVATAAARDARNGPEFLDKVRALGLPVRMLSGEEEALASASGVIAAFPGARGIVADLGGGSLELVDIDAGSSTHGTSLPIGSLRLPQMRALGPAKFSRRVHGQLAGAQWSASAGQTAYLVGGSLRALARFAMHRLDWPLDDPHGFEMAPREALRLCRAIAHGKPPQAVPGISASRLAAIPDTAALLAVLLRELEPGRLVFSSWGLREGLLFQALPGALRERDPLLAGIAEFCAAMGAEPSLASAMARWAAPAVPGAGDPPRERLRLAAAKLALASMRVEPNLRAREAVDWALRKRWIGIDVPGRETIAAALAAHAGRPALLAELARFAPAESIAEGAVWGQAMRLARRFCAGSTRVLEESRLAVEDGSLVLTVAAAHAALCTGQLDRDLAQLAERLRLAPVLRQA